MEWKNYLELDSNRDLYNKYLLNMNDNFDKNFSYNDGNNKIDYYSIINNISNSPSDLDDEEENYFLFPYEEDKDKKINKLSSDLTNNENKEINNKKNLFKIQTFSSTSKDDSKNKEFSLSDDINNSNINSNSNNNSSFNLIQNIPLKERMKIKKEKTKKLLENKTLRSKTDEESKENNMEKNNWIINNKNQESNININNYNFNINNIDKSILSKLSKKEIKMWRNRLSAQRSRDRKKKELLDLKAITKSLLQENEKLRHGIKERDDKIKQLMSLLCPECKNKLNGNNDFNLSIKTNLDSLSNNEMNIQDKSQLTPSSIIGGKKKLALLMTGLFTIFCVFGTLINSNENNLLRSLKEKGGNKNSTTIGFNNEKRVNVPFLIEKDYTKRHQKEIEMYQKIKKNNLKNKNLMVPASLFHNNSEQIISNINNKTNHENENHNNDNDKINDEKNQNNNNNVGNDDKGKFLGNGKIKIIEKEYSNKGNNDIKKDENFKDN
jgi:hypothetical protein